MKGAKEGVENCAAILFFEMKSGNRLCREWCGATRNFIID
jgi:hypothetical protein